MADDIDKANDLAEMERNAAVMAAQRASYLHYCGRCWNCDEPLEEGLFCDTDCRDDHEQRGRFKN